MLCVIQTQLSFWISVSEFVAVFGQFATIL